MFWNIVIGLISFALNLVLAPKPQNAKRASVDDFNVPTADESREIPWLFGTKDLAGPNVHWWGDLKADAIKGARRYGLFGPRQTIGHNYFLGMHMVLCHGVADAIYQIKAGDNNLWKGISKGGRISVKGKAGGNAGTIEGEVDIEMGAPNQGQNSYLKSKLGADVPAFRGVVAAVLRRPNMGETPYLAPWSFTTQRIYKKWDASPQWYPAKAGIGDDGNARKRTVSNINLSHVVAWRFYDVYGSTLAHFSADLSNLIAEDVRSGLVFGATAISYQPVWLYISSLRNEIMVLDSTGVLHTYTLKGAAKSSHSLGIDPTPTGDPLGQLDSPPAEIVVDGATYLFFRVSTSVYCYVSSGSGWTFQWTATGVPQWGGIIAASPTHLVFRHPAGHCSIASWTPGVAPVGGLGASAFINFFGMLGWETTTNHPIISVSYVPESDRWFFTAGVAKIATLNSDCTAVVASGETGGISARSDVQPLKSRRTLTGSDTAAFIGDRVIRFYNIATCTPIEEIPLSEWAWSSFGESDAAYSEEANAFFLVNLEGAFVFLMPNGRDMNPAHIIRECLTDPINGMGYKETDMGDTWHGAANTLYNEGFGLTLLWQREEEIGEFVQMVQSHIDAYVYVDRRTGKFEIKLIRDDYDLDTIPVVTDDDIVSVEDIRRRQPTEAVTTVAVKYFDRKQGKDGFYVAHNPAQVQLSEGTVPTTRHYPGVQTMELASRLAERDGHALSAGFADGRITAKRRLSKLNPGDPFRLFSEKLGFSGEVMRYVDGKLGDGRNNAIRLKFVQDVFGLDAEPLIIDEGTEWENPASEPVPVERRLVHEMPYREMVQAIGEVNATSMLAANPDAGLVQIAGGSPTDDSIQAIVAIDDGTGYEDLGDALQFAPSALVDGALGALATSLPVRDATDLDLVVIGSLAAIGGEIVRIDAVAGNTLTIGRGCLDTVPQAHPDGASVIFFDDFNDTDSVARSAGASISVKLKTVTGRGELDDAEAPADTVTFASRAIRPYRPADVKLNGVGLGIVDARLTDPVVATWAERNRLTEDNKISSWTEESITPETGQTTKITVMDTSRSVLTVHDGVPGTTFSIPHASFAGRAFGIVRFDSVRDGHTSLQGYELLIQVGGVKADTSAYTADTDALKADNG